MCGENPERSESFTPQEQCFRQLALVEEPDTTELTFDMQSEMAG